MHYKNIDLQDQKDEFSKTTIKICLRTEILEPCLSMAFLARMATLLAISVTSSSTQKQKLAKTNKIIQIRLVMLLIVIKRPKTDKIRDNQESCILK